MGEGLACVPLVWFLTDVVPCCSCAVDLDVEPAFLGDVSEDGFAHRGAADVACVAQAMPREWAWTEGCMCTPSVNMGRKVEEAKG